MRPVSGKKVVWVLFAGLALATGLAAWWFWAHAEAIRRGELSPRDASGAPQSSGAAASGDAAR